MAEELQSLLEKINREGVEKATAAAEKIIADAKARAADIIDTANRAAAKAQTDAYQVSQDYSRRAAESVSQAGRDTIRKVELAVTAQLEKLLKENVNRALSDSARVTQLVTDILRSIVTKDTIEVAAAADLAAALKAQLASQSQIKVILDDTLETGFAVRLEGGRVEHAFTGEIVAAELAKRLRPDLAALIHA